MTAGKAGYRTRQFGDYTLLERIGAGGMAEIWRAKMYGQHGFEKEVAIKKILPNLTDDAEFVEMFIDEAKISVELSHANICQVTDLGKISDNYFIAMEYIDGKDLRAIFTCGQSPSALLDCIIVTRVTTKPTGTGTGTGLGLSLAYDIVTQGHGGTLTVESEEGQGATFIITIPMTSQKP